MTKLASLKPSLIVAFTAPLWLFLSSGAFSQDTDSPGPSMIQVEELKGSLGAAPSGTPRRITLRTLELIKEFEGWRSMPYNDVAGYCTIGYGHLIALKRCEEIDLGRFANGLSEDEGQKLLLRDTVRARFAVEKLVNVPLSNSQFGALVSFVYNIGQGAFEKSTLRRKVNLGSFDLANGQFLRWVYSGGKVWKGLQNRRACEQALFRNALALNDEKKIDRSTCIALGAAPSDNELIDIGVGEK